MGCLCNRQPNVVILPFPSCRLSRFSKWVLVLDYCKGNEFDLHKNTQLISIWMVVHQDSLWNWGMQQLGNGLSAMCLCFTLKLSPVGWGCYLDGWRHLGSCIVDFLSMFFVVVVFLLRSRKLHFVLIPYPTESDIKRFLPDLTRCLNSEWDVIASSRWLLLRNWFLHWIYNMLRDLGSFMEWTRY